MKIRHLFIVFICFQFYGQTTIKEVLDQYNSHSVTYISAEELQQKLHQKNNIYLFDTREKIEYDVSHLKNAIWLGFKPMNEDVFNNINKSARIVVYCSIGVRSEKIGEQLIELGFKNVVNLYGGLFEWSNKGFPIYNDKGITSKVHAFDKFWGGFLTNAEKEY